MTEFIICADDFGLSPGVNQAILKAHIKGGLTHTSVLVTAPHVEEAIAQARAQAPNLHIGLHFNLTTGRAVTDPALLGDLVDKDGHFIHGFVGLWMKYLQKPHAMRHAISQELAAQLHKAEQLGLTLSHIDGHHHIHMIPGIFTLVKQAAADRAIPRIRIVNERLFPTFRITPNIDYLWNGGLLKYGLLRLCAWINHTSTSVYFFSILHSCRITPAMVKNLSIPKGFHGMEIMLHPGMPEVDKDDTTNPEYPHLTSPFRQEELATALALKCL